VTEAKKTADAAKTASDAAPSDATKKTTSDNAATALTAAEKAVTDYGITAANAATAA
jgi:hypothetical protein